MHHEINKILYDSYPPGDKEDFFPAYLYMKYLNNFVYQARRTFGFPLSDNLEDLDEGIMEMLDTYIDRLLEGNTAETSIYHSKVVKLADAVKLVTQKEDLHLPVSEKVVPFKIAKDVILTNPDSIAVGTCPCRKTSPKPCLPPPMEVCLFIGDPYASFIADQNTTFRKISQEEAVKILEDCHRKGFVHCAYFKKELGNRFYAICNCCKCCCVMMNVWHLMGGQSSGGIAHSGYVSEVNNDECSGCGACADSCQFDAISINDDSAKAVINLERCMGCGVCEDVCPVAAISLRREPSKGEPLDIDELKRKV